MPGIFGFAQCEKEMLNPANITAPMQDMLLYHPNLRSDSIYSDQFVSAGRCVTDINNRALKPITTDGITIWFDGEFYNQNEIKEQHKVNGSNDLALLHALYLSNDLNSALITIDGIFSAAIYDRNQKTLTILCDRYGMKHVYVSYNYTAIGWASEIKALTVLPWVSRDIDKKALCRFMQYGYFIENDTWFSSVKLIQPASVIKFRLSDGSVNNDTYWSWDRIRPLPGKIDLIETGKEWGRLFTNAVRKRAWPEENVGITLSGGLDSRAILAAFPDGYGQVHTATLGTRGCVDIDIAAKAAAV